MDKNIAIEFNNVGKQYRLGRVGTGTLSHDLNRWWQTSILGKEDPYLKIGETNDRTTKGHSDYVWALKDINFKVEMGDVVGIIGKNGAGKSTLLKLLSHITAPSTGDIRYRGRIASLLEVGTGFHPEMTGRENIYMNGSIMGMTKHEIDKKIDEIVDFAGVERYIDTPVKRYSSGMTVRLGFAVAAFLEPEILVVDEVLTVGDAEFQKKAIGKMQDVAHGGQGRTVLFVSHNMASVRKLCNTCILLENGGLRYQGDTETTIGEYMQIDAMIMKGRTISELPREGNVNGHIRFVDFEILDENDNNIIPHCGRYMKVRVHYEVVKGGTENATISCGVRDCMGNMMVSFPAQLTIEPTYFEEGPHYADCIIPKLPLTQGNYRMSLWAGDIDGQADYIEAIIPLEVIEDDYFGIGRTVSAAMAGRTMLCDHKWIFK